MKLGVYTTSLPSCSCLFLYAYMRVSLDVSPFPGADFKNCLTNTASIAYSSRLFTVARLADSNFDGNNDAVDDSHYSSGRDWWPY